MKSMKPRKQRKVLYNAPGHIKRNWISSHLEENLLLKYDKRAVPVVKGDTIRVMRGSFKGHEDKVVKVDVGRSFLEIEGITMSKADGNKIAKPIHPSNVMIIKLNLTDKWRRKKLERGLSEETKKEIEKEAEKQIKEVEEEEKRKEEEEAKTLEEEKEITEDKTQEPEKIEKQIEQQKKEKISEIKPKKEQTEEPKKVEKKIEPQKKEQIPETKPKKEQKKVQKSEVKPKKEKPIEIKKSEISPAKKTEKKEENK